MVARSSNVSSCPFPFIAELSVPYHGGYLGGRWCKPVPIAVEDVSCCIPCPISDWRYTKDFSLVIVSWIGVFILVLALILGLTFAVLPVAATWRHYLTTSPLIGFTFMAAWLISFYWASFIIQLGASIDVCYDSITPNDWRTDNRCAVSGALLLYGVWVVVLSCFFRSLSLYAHLCWEIELGTKFMYIALVCIFVGAGGLFLTEFLVSGVSYQVGKICSINIDKSTESLWAPLLAVASASLILQLLIMAHCIHRVLDPFGNMFKFLFTCRRARVRASVELPPELAEQPSARQVCSRIRRILQLQWRAIAIVCLIIFHVAFLAGALLRVGTPADYSLEQVTPWLVCLMTSHGESEPCLSEASGLGPSQGTALAAWILLSLSGVWGFICVVKWSMVQGWIEWGRRRRSAFRESMAYRHRAQGQPRDVERVVSDCLTVDTMYSPTSAVHKALRFTRGSSVSGGAYSSETPKY
ncbi:hypothetical protein P175DRAFT_0426348 [Aspergillus ochraceoroseus IBT 24754]|nr:uncharacterized protein P175DRAFT_0426348 [Aspergillus ochraceoroseus IBT 24754]PTU24608.1 hypothetical protein P175DRAFT_0426348 [Aspergillus ochraceoroseus IBT 24754]